MKSVLVCSLLASVCGVLASCVDVRGPEGESVEGGEGIRWVEAKKSIGLGEISFRLKEIPGQEFMLIFPEWLTSKEIGYVAIFNWRKGRSQATGSWRSGPYSATLTIRFEQSGQKYELKWEYEFENGSDKQLTDLAAFNCFNLNRAALFKDLAMEQTWVMDEKGNKVLLKEVPKTQGKGKRTMQFYPAVEGIDFRDINFITRWGVTSTAHLSGDRIGVVSKDGYWLAETIVDGPVAYFFNNWEGDHGCIHTAPLFGTVEPGKTAKTKGRISFTKLK